MNLFLLLMNETIIGNDRHYAVLCGKNHIRIANRDRTSGKFYERRSNRIDLATFYDRCITSMAKMFSGSRFTELHLVNFDTSEIVNMRKTFNRCTKLVTLDLTKREGFNFDTSKVISMKHMFKMCNRLTELIIPFNTSNVICMNGMFRCCNSLNELNLSSFDTSRVLSMNYMFSGCYNLTNIIFKFITSNVVKMQSMFNECQSLKSIDLSSFDTSHVTNMNYMFCRCESLSSLNLSSFNTSRVLSMKYMFANCKSLQTLILSSDDGTSMFNTLKVTTMNSMFSHCISLTELILPSTFDTSNVKDMGHMFSSCGRVDSNVPTNKGLTTLKLSFNTINVTNMEYMFYDCNGLTEIDLGRNPHDINSLSMFDTSKVVNANYMFANCTNLTKITFREGLFNVPNESYGCATDIFSGCSSLKYIEFVNQDGTYNSSMVDIPTSKNFFNMTSISNMFNNCESLEYMNLAWLNTESTLYIDFMFRNCISLKHIDMSTITTMEYTRAYNMFENCKSLLFINLYSITDSVRSFIFKNSSIVYVYMKYTKNMLGEYRGYSEEYDNYIYDPVYGMYKQI